MSDWPQKGDYVVARKGGTGSLAQGYGRVSYSEGAELIVTSLTADFVRVRHAGGGRVFLIHRNNIHPVPRMIGEIPEGGLAPEDPRIAWLFEDAGRMADRLGLCAVTYDFGLQMPPEVKDVDTRILLNERTALLGEPPRPWSVSGAPLDVVIEGWDPAHAEREYLARFTELHVEAVPA